MFTKIILLFSLALDKTYAVLKISFTTMPHAVGTQTGSDISNFGVFIQLKSIFRANDVSLSHRVGL